MDKIIQKHAGWKGDLIAEFRAIIKQANPHITEDVKWKMKTRPEGLPVWVLDGNICFAEIWKDNVKLLFPKGADLKDPHGLFNARLKSKDIRAIEFKEGDSINKDALTELVREASL